MCLECVMTKKQIKSSFHLKLCGERIDGFKVVRSHNKRAIFHGKQAYWPGRTIKRKIKSSPALLYGRYGNPVYECGIHLFLTREGAQKYVCYSSHEIIVSVTFSRKSVIVWGIDCNCPVVVVKTCRVEKE